MPAGRRQAHVLLATPLKNVAVAVKYIDKMLDPIFNPTRITHFGDPDVQFSCTHVFLLMFERD
jgi:hypothetical protein